MLAGKILRGKISPLSVYTGRTTRNLNSLCRLLADAAIRPLLVLTTALLLLWAFAPITVQAQSFQGSLRGLVKDSSGNAMPAVSIALINEETNSTRNTVTNDAGEYLLERVDPGKYKVSAWTNGFKKVDHPAVTVETQKKSATIKAIMTARLPVAFRSAAFELSVKATKTGTMPGGSTTTSRVMNAVSPNRNNSASISIQFRSARHLISFATIVLLFYV